MQHQQKISAEGFIDEVTQRFQATQQARLGPHFRSRSKSYQADQFLLGRKSFTPALIVLEEQALIAGGAFQGLRFLHECPTERNRLVIGIGANIRAVDGSAIPVGLYQQFKALLNMDVSQGGQATSYGLGLLLTSDPQGATLEGTVDRPPLQNILPYGAGWGAMHPMAALAPKETLTMSIPQIATPPVPAQDADVLISLVLQTVDFVQQ